MIADFFEPMQLDMFIRPALQKKLGEALDAERWEESSLLLAAFIDTWPVGGSIRTALAKWKEENDGLALCILSRANEIIQLVGAPAEEIPIEAELPSFVALGGTELADRRAELCRQAALGELKAAVFSSPVPVDPASQLALGELRMEAESQHAVEAYGLAGLLAPDAPQWESALGPAPSGRPGENLRAMCDIAILPGTPARLRQGRADPVGWLLWRGPARPLPVADSAVELIRNIGKGIQGAVDAAGLEAEQGRAIVRELVSLGALGA
jgi:hypothetical protein